MGGYQNGSKKQCERPWAEFMWLRTGVQQRTYENTVVNLQIPHKEGNFSDKLSNC
jgi:hypothetical protein